MHITLVMVQSLDGKITNGKNPDDTSWKSKEDQAFFHDLHKKHRLIVMGRKTYEAFRHQMDFTNNQLRIVITRHPERFQKDAIPHKLEFTNESPPALVDRLTKLGHSRMLLVGGSEINTEFFKSRLINELYLTIEPILLTDGLSIAANDCPDIRLQLLSVKRLNPHVTLLLHYKICF